MDGLARLTSVLNRIAVLLAGVVLILGYTGALEHGLLGRGLNEPLFGLVWMLPAALLVILNVAYALAWYRHRSAEITVASPIRHGRVQVTLRAIEFALKQASRSLPEVRDVDIRVRRARRGKNPLLVQCRYAATDGCALTPIHEKLASLLVDRLREIISLADPPTIEIVLARIHKRPPTNDTRTSRSDRTQSQRDWGIEDSHFTGPKYPIN